MKRARYSPSCSTVHSIGTSSTLPDGAVDVRGDPPVVDALVLRVDDVGRQRDRLALLHAVGRRDDHHAIRHAVDQPAHQPLPERVVRHVLRRPSSRASATATCPAPAAPASCRGRTADTRAPPARGRARRRRSAARWRRASGLRRQRVHATSAAAGRATSPRASSAVSVICVDGCDCARARRPHDELERRRQRLRATPRRARPAARRPAACPPSRLRENDRSAAEREQAAAADVDEVLEHPLLLGRKAPTPRRCRG